MRFRKPELIPSLFIIAATVVLAGLGAWQLQRLEWKTQLISEVNGMQGRTALTMLPPAFNEDKLRYRKVELRGHFLDTHVFRRISGRREKGGEFLMLSPFALKDDGRVILVNRGLSPSAGEVAADGTQVVIGFLRPPHSKPPFLPDNDQTQNIWFDENLDAMSQLAGTPLLPLVVETGKTPHFRNDHLGYAVTWFALAVVGLIMFAFYHRLPQDTA